MASPPTATDARTNAPPALPIPFRQTCADATAAKP
jgi:hypothetical protein